MTNFKIGDRVKVKKLSEKEFEKTYHSFSYKTYLREYSKYFGNIYKIIAVFQNSIRILDDNNNDDWFISSRFIKAYSLKDRLQLAKELIK
jgi:hypothetical protein